LILGGQPTCQRDYPTCYCNRGRLHESTWPFCFSYLPVHGIGRRKKYTPSLDIRSWKKKLYFSSDEPDALRGRRP
jgi:hypothetical protein